MTSAVPDILARIVAKKREELASARIPLPELEAEAARRLADRRDFAAAIARAPAIIAEIKKASPSKGVLSENFDPAAIARNYEDGGAAALSVLTDESFFQGSMADLDAARAATRLPVLRKDFTLEERHVIEAAAGGADAILLLAAVLDSQRLRELRKMAEHYRMAALVEVHSERELDAAMESGARVIGVNNRDLKNFQVDLETSLRLAPLIPKGAIKVAESGIRSREDVVRLQDAGYHAFLVGEHLMKSPSPAAALRALVSER